VNNIMAKSLNPDTVRYTLIIRTADGKGVIDRKEYGATWEELCDKHDVFLAYDKFSFARNPGTNITINPEKQLEREKA
jgi:hypothetical protein